MKNVTKKALSCVLAAACMVSVFAGCDKKDVKDIKDVKDAVNEIASDVYEKNKNDKHNDEIEYAEAERIDDELMAQPEDIQATLEETFPTQTEENRVQFLDEYDIGTYENETLTWIVITTMDGKALLLSKKVIDLIPYNTENTDVTWETCSLRKWLNEDLYNTAFTAEERQMIVKTTVDNTDIPDEGDQYGNDTEDYLYILSTRELECLGDFTEYDAPSYTQIALEHNYNLHCPYWRRDPGTKASGEISYDTLAVVDFDGRLYPFCYDVESTTVGVRPAMWVDIDMLVNM